MAEISNDNSLILESRMPPAFLLFGKTELVTVKVKGINKDSITTADSGDIKIPKETAVCRFCFHKFIENDDNQDVLKTCCCIYMTLAHTKCVEDWFRKKGVFKCEMCDQDIKFIPVVILSSAATKDPPQRQKPVMSKTDGSCKIL